MCDVVVLMCAVLLCSMRVSSDPLPPTVLVPVLVHGYTDHRAVLLGVGSGTRNMLVAVITI